MPKHTKKVNLADFTEDQITEILGQIGDITLTGQVILSLAVDFLKKLGLLVDFTEFLVEPWRQKFIEIFIKRPKEMGGNPFA